MWTILYRNNNAEWPLCQRAGPQERRTVTEKRSLSLENVYGYEDDGLRFALFGLAVVRMLEKIDFQPEVINCND
ncbi:glycogen/starch synthase [Candidatus Hakubella thermalkaliphila]